MDDDARGVDDRPERRLEHAREIPRRWLRCNQRTSALRRRPVAGRRSAPDTAGCGHEVRRPSPGRRIRLERPDASAALLISSMDGIIVGTPWAPVEMVQYYGSAAHDESRPDPKFRPLERFWPYAELPEQPTDEELAALDPDLHEALFGSRSRGRSRSRWCFPALDVAGVRPRARTGAAHRPSSARPARVRRIGIARASGRATPRGCATCSRSSGASDATEVLIDDRPVPYARELWLPLVWFLIPR